MSNLVAVITSKWGSRGYKGIPVPRVQTYTMDSAMDTDADQWSIDIGDPRSDLVTLLRRDSEVRVRLAMQNNNKLVEDLIVGYADQIGLTENGVLALQGRDLSAAAIDDTALPHSWRPARPDKIIIDQARQRGFSRLSNVAKVAAIPKLSTDGSESVWELWYRMIRKKKMWIWTEPDGALHVNFLNYAHSPTYFFGTPPNGDHNPASWMRVERVQIMKNTASRVGEVIVYGENGLNSIIEKAQDTFIKDWIKRPVKIITADQGKKTSRAEARKDAQEEVFESIVGSLEITITVADPGFIIRQNRVARLNLPDIDYQGDFFVVGTRLLGGTDGFVQEVRLREKKYALTRRVPTDPKLAEEKAGGNLSASSAGADINTGQKHWGGYFLIAAQDFHGDWDFALFLAVLLGICSKETNFMNVRQGNSGGPEWSDPPLPITNRDQAARQGGNTLAQWRSDFANVAGNPLNPLGSSPSGVGPMQLTLPASKAWADERMGIIDEYIGGRWHPSANIWAAAKLLASDLQGLPPTQDNIWIGVAKYNAGNSWQGGAGQAYMRDVRQRVLAKGGFLSQVQTDLASAKTLPANSLKTLADYGGEVPDVIRKMINFAERQEGSPYLLGASGPDKYDCSGLVYAAYAAAGLSSEIGGRQSTWGYWNKGKGYGNLFFVPVDKLLPGDMVFFNVPSDGGAPPQHMGLYYQDNQMIVASRPGTVLQVQSIIAPGSWTCMGGMRLPGLWKAPAATGSTSGVKKTYTVMIQAGHDTGSHADQPYGHTGESGAPGEVDFTISVRDRILAHLNSDNRFNGVKGTAWSASAGASALPGDDIDFNGDMFIAIHYDAASAEGSRYFFGYPNQRGAAVQSASLRLINNIVTHYNNLSGHPTRKSADDNAQERLYGYYAWGAPTRAFPDNVDHTPGVPVKCLMECGEGGTPGGQDHAWLVGHIPEIGRAIYLAICDYYNIDPVG